MSNTTVVFTATPTRIKIFESRLKKPCVCEYQHCGKAITEGDKVVALHGDRRTRWYHRSCWKRMFI